MATYCVTFSDEDDWGEASDRFKTKPAAENRLAEVEATGRFARLIVWDKNESSELRRVNTTPDGNSQS